MRRPYLLPRVIELGFAAGRSFGVNIYLIDGGSEFVLLDVGLADSLDEVIDTVRRLDFPLSRCKALVATHADADHVQGLAAARERLKARTVAHPHAAERLERGEVVETFARITAQGFDIPMPPCPIDDRVGEGDVLPVGDLRLEVWHTPGHTPGQLSVRLGDLLFSGDNLYKDGCVGVIDAHHGSSLPDFVRSLERIRDCDATHLLPSHGPAFRRDPAMVQRTIDRLTGYMTMADFGPCAVRWPLQEQWERDVLAGVPPEV
jgi:glyoxylase-like metal-dependent hydrolase (beta-lactamase superfamily II)